MLNLSGINFVFRNYKALHENLDYFKAYIQNADNIAGLS